MRQAEKSVIGEKMKRLPILYAILAAACYGISTPVAKLVLEDMPPVFMASMLYLGAGLGMIAVNIFRKTRLVKEEFCRDA